VLQLIQREDARHNITAGDSDDDEEEEEVQAHSKGKSSSPNKK
jgi:hypothetical protein